MKIYSGHRVDWVSWPVRKLVKIPASNILFMEGNTWDFAHASALYDAIRHGDAPPLDVPAGRIYRIDASEVKLSQKYEAAGELEYQMGMTEPWDKSDIGSYYAQLLDGNHRALAALAAGEPYIWVYCAENSLPNVRKKDLK